MKVLYTVLTEFMNGYNVLATDIASFPNKELAEKAKVAIEKANENAMFKARCSISETKLYMTEDEVPILNQK